MGLLDDLTRSRLRNKAAELLGTNRDYHALDIEARDIFLTQDRVNLISLPSLHHSYN